MEISEAYSKYNVIEARHAALNHLRINLALILAESDGYLNTQEVNMLKREFPYFESREILSIQSTHAESIEFCCKRILSFTDNNKQATDSFFIKLFKVAVADGDLQAKEIEVIEKVAKYFDIKDDVVVSIMQMYFSNYKIVNTNKANKQDLKRVMKSLHPDKFFCLELLNDNLKAQIIELANQRLKSFNEYYQEKFA